MQAKKIDENLLINKYTNWVIKNRWYIIIVTLILTGLFGSGGRLLKIDTDYRAFFGKDNPQLQSFEEIQNTYSKNDNILFVLAVEDEEVFTKNKLDAIEKLTEEAWKIPYSSRVDAITNFQHSYSEEDDLIVEDLVQDAINKSSEQLKHAKVIALSEPFLFKRLISENAKVTGVNVTLQFPKKEMSETPEAAAYARNLAEKIEKKYPGIKVYITGVAMLNNAFSEASINDMQTLTPLMFLAMFLIMFFSLRSVSGTITTILVITFSTATAMGIAGWFATGITPPSAQAPTIIMTLAIADSIHILVTILREMGLGRSKEFAIRESIRVNMQPVFLTSISTIIGFLTMNFSEVPPFNHLGNITSVGVLAAFVFSITFLPAFISVLPIKIKKVKEKKDTDKFINTLADFVIKRRKSLFYSGILTTLIFGAFIFSNRLDDSFVEYFDESVDFRTDTDFTTNNLTGIYQLQFSLFADESGGISNPEYLNKLEEFANWYRIQDKVLHVNSFTDVMKRLNKNMHSDDKSFYSVPQSRDLAAQYLLLYEMSLPYGLDLNNQINVDKSATRFIVTLNDVSSKQILELTELGENWLKKNAPNYMSAYGTGAAVMFSNISKINIKSMINGSIVALLLISGLMVFALRNRKIGILSLVPNLMPAIMGFGLWGLTNGRIDTGLSIVMGMTLGIVVDDTIHFLSKYIRARKEFSLTPEDAVRYSFTTVGRALIITSSILVVGFGILSFSSFLMNGHMAKLTAITILIALIADFLFLPALLMKVEEYKSLVDDGKEKPRNLVTANAEI